MVSTLAGDGTYGWADGLGTAARFSYPTGVSVDSNGTVYVADFDNNRIRMVTSSGACCDGRIVVGSLSVCWRVLYLESK